MNKILSWFCYLFLKPIISFVWIKEVKGLENIPKKTTFILASNHQSHWDQVINGYLCVPRRFTYLGQVDQYKGFDGFLRNFLYFIADVIPIHRQKEESKKKAIEECIKRLKKGDVLIIYPEGTRTRDGNIGKAKIGVAKIYLKTGVPILPVAIKGAFELMPVGKRFPKLKKIIKIKVGKPLEFKEELELAQKLACQSEDYKRICQKIIDVLMSEITKMLSELE